MPIKTIIHLQGVQIGVDDEFEKVRKLYIEGLRKNSILSFDKPSPVIFPANRVLAISKQKDN